MKEIKLDIAKLINNQNFVILKQKKDTYLIKINNKCFILHKNGDCYSMLKVPDDTSSIDPYANTGYIQLYKKCGCKGYCIDLNGNICPDIEKKDHYVHEINEIMQCNLSAIMLVIDDKIIAYNNENLFLLKYDKVNNNYTIVKKVRFSGRAKKCEDRIFLYEYKDNSLSNSKITKVVVLDSDLNIIDMKESLPKRIKSLYGNCFLSNSELYNYDLTLQLHIQKNSHILNNDDYYNFEKQGNTFFQVIKDEEYFSFHLRYIPENIKINNYANFDIDSELHDYISLEEINDENNTGDSIQNSIDSQSISNLSIEDKLKMEIQNYIDKYNLKYLENDYNEITKTYKDKYNLCLKDLFQHKNDTILTLDPKHEITPERIKNEYIKKLELFLDKIKDKTKYFKILDSIRNYKAALNKKIAKDPISELINEYVELLKKAFANENEVTFNNYINNLNTFLDNKENEIQNYIEKLFKGSNDDELKYNSVEELEIIIREEIQKLITQFSYDYDAYLINQSINIKKKNIEKIINLENYYVYNTALKITNLIASYEKIIDDYSTRFEYFNSKELFNKLECIKERLIFKPNATVNDNIILVNNLLQETANIGYELDVASQLIKNMIR